MGAPQPQVLAGCFHQSRGYCHCLQLSCPWAGLAGTELPSQGCGVRGETLVWWGLRNSPFSPPSHTRAWTFLMVPAMPLTMPHLGSEAPCNTLCNALRYASCSTPAIPHAVCPTKPHSVLQLHCSTALLLLFSFSLPPYPHTQTPFPLAKRCLGEG